MKKRVKIETNNKLSVRRPAVISMFSLLIISGPERIYMLTMNEAEDTESWCQQQTLIQILCHKTSKYTSQKYEVWLHGLTWAQKQQQHHMKQERAECCSLKEVQVSNMAAIQRFTWYWVSPYLKNPIYLVHIPGLSEGVS